MIIWGFRFDEDLHLLPMHDMDGQLRAVVEFLSETGRENVLRGVATVAVTDSGISSAEQRILEQVGASLGMTSAHGAGVLSAVQQGR